MRRACQTIWFTAFVGVLALLLTAAQSGATPPKRPPPVAPVQISAPEALLWRIYTLPDPDVGAFIDPERRPQFYSSRIDKLAKRMERCYAKKYGMDFLDIDFIVPGNDYDIRDLSIGAIKSGARDAHVRVAFNRSGQTYDPVKLDYFLKLTRAGWRIDNVAYEKETLAKSLSGKC